jgi:hypothetical protein
LIKVEFGRRELAILFFVIIGLDLLFIIMTSPIVSLSADESQPARVNSVMDFVRFQFDLKNERNIATWYSSGLLLMAGLAALLNIKAVVASGWQKRALRAGWALVAAVCIWLSADETAMIHETLAPLIKFTSQDAKVRVGAGDWIPILLPFIIITAAGMGLFFWLVHSENKRFALLALAGVVCWVGAIWAEAIEAQILKLDIPRGVEGLVEEGLEIIGTSLLLFAFVDYYGKEPATGRESSRRGKADAGSARSVR